jgi:hypothetical protein
MSRGSDGQEAKGIPLLACFYLFSEFFQIRLLEKSRG